MGGGRRGGGWEEGGCGRVDALNLQQCLSHKGTKSGSKNKQVAPHTKLQAAIVKIEKKIKKEKNKKT